MRPDILPLVLSLQSRQAPIVSPSGTTTNGKRASPNSGKTLLDARVFEIGAITRSAANAPGRAEEPPLISP